MRVFNFSRRWLRAQRREFQTICAPNLPYLLWVYSMGIVLFWIHDQSPKHRRTYRLIDHTVDLLDKLIHLASNPFMRPLRKQALRLVEEIREALPDGDESETT